MSIQRTTTLHLIMPCMCDTIELWLPQLGAGWMKQFWGGSKIAGRMTNCRVGGICREEGKWWVQKSGGLNDGYGNYGNTSLARNHTLYMSTQN